MDFTLTEDQRLLRQEIIKFARQELNDDVAARDRDQSFPRELWRQCGELGLPGLPVPEQYGGSGLDGLGTAMALEALGYGCEDSGLVFSLSAHLLACVVPVLEFGTDEQKERLLPGLSDGSLIAANAMSEPESGSDAFGLMTRAEIDGDGFVLKGTKTFVTNGPVADLLVVFALTDPDKRFHGGITSFLVESDRDGVSVGPKFEKMGLRSSPLCELAFNDTFVPASSVLGGVGGGADVFMHSMQWERACLFAGHVGTMDRVLEQAVRYARTRKQQGQSIGKFQAVSHRLADMKTQIEGARLLTYKAAWQLGRTRRASLDASISKLFVSESLVSSALAAIQVFGGYGYMTEMGVERVLRDAVASTLYSGTSEIQKNLIAGWLGL